MSCGVCSVPVLQAGGKSNKKRKVDSQRGVHTSCAPRACLHLLLVTMR